MFMGYTLTIGEAEIDYDDDRVRVSATDVTLDDAPAFGEPTDRMNTRWPSYSQWSNAMKDLGLTDLMFAGKRGDGTGAGSFEWGGKEYEPLMIDHPGAQPITEAHLAYAEEKIAAYKAAHPDHRAEYPPPKEGAVPICGMYRQEDVVQDPRYDGNLCRAEWLLFWMRWALKNCKQPVFVNS
jgi:hypothetical protein